MSRDFLISLQYCVISWLWRVTVKRGKSKHLLLKLFVQVYKCAFLRNIRALLGKIRAAGIRLFL
jgi:hypothetical protein